MRRISLAAATMLALVPIGGPAEAGERQRGTVIGVAKVLGGGITEIKITARLPGAASGRG